MAVNKRPGQKLEVDLEATDELPAPDFADSLEAQVNTDVFPAPVIPAGMADLADSLRDVEHRLQRKSERVHRLESELAGAAESLQQLTGRLQQQEAASAAREATLQQQLGEVQQQLALTKTESAARENELHDARRELGELRAALHELRQQLTQRSGEHAYQEHDLAEWRRRAERQHEALVTWQGFRSVSEALLGESERALRETEDGYAAQLAAVQTRVSAMEAELLAARAESAQGIAMLEQAARRADELNQTTAAELAAANVRATALTAELAARETSIALLQSQLAELRAVEEKARIGAAAYEEQLQQIQSLEEELEDAQRSGGEIAQQLRQSMDRVQRLESTAHASAALLGNLQQNIERLGRDDSGSRPALKETTLDVGVRVLIRQEGGADVVYPLSRRTTIGRTAENDIQIDTSYVSRHHAVLLSSADHCIVEDLNSTNGVLVNGRRVGRQALQDGDTVTVGKTEFRYQQRS
jgi:predicted  nucleic acid-binding Zn-ribbon protein